MKPASSINRYIKVFPPAVQKQLHQLRQAIHQAVPKAIEVISYGMPAFKQNRVLVYFAAFKDHISLSTKMAWPFFIVKLYYTYKYRIIEHNEFSNKI